MWEVETFQTFLQDFFINFPSPSSFLAGDDDKYHQLQEEQSQQYGDIYTCIYMYVCVCVYT
jgi:hypothetical protein